MYGAVCDDTVGFFAVLPKDEPRPARIVCPLGIEARRKRWCAGVRVIASQQRQPPAPRTAVRREEHCGVDLEVPQPFVCDIRGREAAFNAAVPSQQEPARFFRGPRGAIGANFRKRLPCNSKHHANIAIQ